MPCIISLTNCSYNLGFLIIIENIDFVPCMVTAQEYAAKRNQRVLYISKLPPRKFHSVKKKYIIVGNCGLLAEVL